MKELARASGHCCYIKELEVKVFEKVSKILLAESALRTCGRTVEKGLPAGGDWGSLKTMTL